MTAIVALVGTFWHPILGALQPEPATTEKDIGFVVATIDYQSASVFLANNGDEGIIFDGIICTVAIPRRVSDLLADDGAALRWPKGSEVIEVVEFFYDPAEVVSMAQGEQRVLTLFSQNPWPKKTNDLDRDKEYKSSCILTAQTERGTVFGAATYLAAHDLFMFGAEDVLSSLIYPPDMEERKERILEELGALLGSK